MDCDCCIFNLKDMIPIIAAIIAIGGVGITAYVSLQQVRKNNIIAARIKWLESLKTLISDFLTDSYDIMRLLGNNDFNGASQKRIHLHKWLTLIKLHLNDKEKLSQHLLKKLGDIMNHIDNSIDTSLWTAEKFNRFEQLNEKVQEISSCILKIEWEVTKSGDIIFKNEEQRKKLRLEYENRFNEHSED
jgi:hypothetical protein